MQRVILTGMFFLFASVAVNAEVIQSVNFNPARFGQYERLKVSDKATFLGGMSAQSMRVQSAGTVTINESPSNGQGRLVYDILKLDATKGFSSLGDDFPGDPTLNFPNTCFGSLENCVTSSATGTLNVSFQNGKARFQAPASYTDNASRINQITTQADQLRIEAIYATIKGKLNVTGNGTYSYRNQTASTPLRLAGNWVPLPSADGAPQNATLKWENRTTVKYADHGGETVRILVLDGGTTGGGGGCTPTRGNTYEDACPGGQTGSITYTWNQAQCKYLQTANTCKEGASYKYGPQQTITQTFRETVPPDSGLSCGFSSYSSFCNSSFGSALQTQQYLSRNGFSSFDNNAAQGKSCTSSGNRVYKPSGVSFGSGSLGCVRAVSNPNGNSSCDIDIVLVIPYFVCQ